MAGTVLAGTELTSDKLGVPPWTAMSLVNSWANFGAGNTNAQYRLWKQLNEVECIGTINGGANNTVFFTLPFTPVSIQTKEAQSGVTVQVATSGAMTVGGYTSGGFNFHFWVSLDA